MTPTVLLVLGVGSFLAYVNGANDVSKGIATLVGSGVTDYRRAIAWGALWTATGGLLGALFAGAMLATFGNGLMVAGTTPTFAAALAVVVGAAGWVLLATRTGLPVSTTHAIVGSLVGVASLAYGSDAVRWSAIGGKVFVPLLVSPGASLVLTAALLKATRKGVRSSEARAEGLAEARADCLCMAVEPAVAVTHGGASVAAMTVASGHLLVTTGSTEACAATRPAALRVTLDQLHWLTSGATSLARGMNDAPKIVALLIAAGALAGGAPIPTPLLFGIVTTAMVAGSLAAGLRVTQVLAEKVTRMDHHEGFSANLVTSGLVAAGAVLGLPMSTTHVSSGGIVSVGAARGSLDLRTLRDIVLAWLVTLPAAAGLGAVAYGVGGWLVS